MSVYSGVCTVCINSIYILFNDWWIFQVGGAAIILQKLLLR